MKEVGQRAAAHGSTTKRRKQGVGEGKPKRDGRTGAVRKLHNHDDTPLVWLLVAAAAVMVYRVTSALLVRTSFVPDEYWQSLEVAHRHVYGYGYLTWEWEHRLRGFLHPGVFALVYGLLRLLRVDSPEAVIAGPRIVQGLVQAVGDWALYALARTFFGQRIALWALGCQLISWFTFYCGVRTVSNSMETVLVTIVLLCWPWDTNRNPSATHRKNRLTALAVGVLAFIIRPTSGVIFAWLGLRALWYYSFRERLRFLFLEALPIGVAGIGLGCTIDYFFYGEFTLVPWNFVKFNVAQNISAFYGTHPMHWYVTQGLPTILGSFAPVFMLGIWWCKRYELLYTLIWSVCIYSLLPHKEFRFILPILPIAHVYVGYCLHFAYSKVIVHTDTTIGGESAQRRQHSTLQAPFLRMKSMRTLFVGGCALLLITHAGMAYYFSFWHQRGPIDVMNYLREEVARNETNDMDVFFLMPCHSTPYYAYIHRPISMDFLSCPPPIKYDSNHTYVDETTMFYANPRQFLVDRFGKQERYPSHIILFEPLLSQIEPFLATHNYRQVVRFWHTLLVVDERQGNAALIYKRHDH